MKAYQNQGPTNRPTAYDPNTSYRPNEYEDEPFDRNAPYRPQNDPYQQPPEPENTTPTKKPANVTRRVAIGVGALALLGAAGFGALRFGLVDALLGSNEPEPEPQPDQQPTELPTLVPAGNYIVGQDIEPGYWRANQFNIGSDFLKIISAKSNHIFTLKQPMNQEELAIWANQELWVRLEDGDQVQSGGTLTKMGREDIPASNSTKIPPMKSGLLFGGYDLTTGTWEINPETVSDFINVKGKKPTDDDPEEIKPYTVMEANTTWNGRLLSIIAEKAKTDELSAKDIAERYCGVLILDPTDLANIDEPFLLANLEFTENGTPVATATDTNTATDATATTDANTATGANTPTNANTPTPQATPDTTQSETIEQQTTANARVTPVENAPADQTTNTAPATTEQPTQDTTQQPTANQPVANTPTQTTPTDQTQQQPTDATQQQSQQQPIDQTQPQQTDATAPQQPIDQTQTTDPNQQQVDATQQTQQQYTQYITAESDPTLTLDTDLLMSMLEDNTANSRFEHVTQLSTFEIDDQTIILPVLVSLRMTRISEVPATEQPQQTETTEETQQN